MGPGPQSIEGFRGERSDPSHQPQGDTMRASKFIRALSLPSILLVAGVVVAAAPAAHATYAGLNGRIAFEAGLKGGLQIWSMRSDGTGRMQLTHFPSGAAEFPDTSPDGSRIAFDADASGEPELYTMNADGSDLTQITDDPNAADLAPRYSPDGSKILFDRCKANCNLWVLNADGTGSMTRITTGRTEEFAGSYSPDGSKIVFDSNRKGLESAIWVMDANGANLHRLTPPSLEAFWPDWSSDGTQIVFSDNCCQPHSSIWVMNADGTGLTQVTSPPYPHDDAFPSFSPKGNKIVFTGNRNYIDLSGVDVFTVNVDGSGLTRISTNLIPDGCEDCIPTADWGAKT